MATGKLVETLVASETRAQRGLDAAVRGTNPQLAALNLRQLFYTQVHLGLISWRRRDVDVLMRLSAALSTAEQAASVLPPLGLTLAEHTFPLSVACGVASLLASQTFLVAHAPTLRSSCADDGNLGPEAALALVVAGQEAGEFLSSVLAVTPFTAEQSLWRKSLVAYAAVLRGDEDTAVPEAELLYSLRGKDPYFIGGRGMYGGGPDNDMVVDLWLGAALNHVQYQGPSSHRWVGA